MARSRFADDVHRRGRSQDPDDMRFDIDVDFEHQRREEVIQYLYQKYGRDRTALTATVITYRTRSAIRDVGKALGMAEVTDDYAEAFLRRWVQRNAADAADTSHMDPLRKLHPATLSFTHLYACTSMSYFVSGKN